MAKSASSNTNFEKQLQQLEDLVEQMENGDVSLEDSLKSFEKGIKLARSCQNALKEAELKVKILLSEDISEDNSKLTDFEE